MDSAGGLHVALLHQEPEKSLVYGHRIGWTWQFEVLDAEGGGPPSIAIDGAGRPNVVYRSAEGLTHVVKIGDTWERSIVDPDGIRSAQAVTSKGEVVIAYWTFERGLHIARREGTGWKTELVLGYTQDSFALAIDKHDNPELVFENQFARPQTTIDHLQMIDGSWSSSKIETARSDLHDGRISLVKDREGTSHVAFVGEQGIRVASFVGGKWELATFAQATKETEVSLSVDSQGVLVLAVIDAVDGQLTVARRVQGQWHSVLVDSGIDLDAPTLCIDPDDNAHVLYVDQNDNVRLAY